MRCDTGDLFEKVDRKLKASLEADLEGLRGVCESILLFEEAPDEVEEPGSLKRETT